MFSAPRRHGLGGGVESCATRGKHEGQSVGMDKGWAGIGGEGEREGVRARARAPSSRRPALGTGAGRRGRLRRSAPLVRWGRRGGREGGE